MRNPNKFEPDQLQLQIAQEIRYSECELYELKESKQKALDIQLQTFLKEQRQILDDKLTEYESCFEEDLNLGTRRSRMKASYTSPAKTQAKKTPKDSDSSMQSTAVSDLESKDIHH